MHFLTFLKLFLLHFITIEFFLQFNLTRSNHEEWNEVIDKILKKDQRCPECTSLIPINNKIILRRILYSEISVDENDPDMQPITPEYQLNSAEYQMTNKTVCLLLFVCQKTPVMISGIYLIGINNFLFSFTLHNKDSICKQRFFFSKKLVYINNKSLKLDLYLFFHPVVIVGIRLCSPVTNLKTRLPETVEGGIGSFVTDNIGTQTKFGYWYKSYLNLFEIGKEASSGYSF